MNSSMPEITIIIPLYNKAFCIESTINTVLNQTVSNFELIIVNDGSTDGSEKIVAEISDSRIKVINQKNAGVSAARNKGAAESSSDFIAFLDADDGWNTDHIEALIALRKKFPEVGLYATDHAEHFIKFSDIARQRGVKLKTQMLLDYFKIFRLLGVFPVHSSCFAVKKSIMREVGGYNCNFNTAEDLDFFGRILFRYPMMAFTLDGLAHYNTQYRELSKTSASSEVSLDKNALYIPKDIHNNAYSAKNESFFLFIRLHLHSHPDLITYVWFCQFLAIINLIITGKKCRAILYLFRCYHFYKCIPDDKLFFVKKICGCLCICLVPKIFMEPLKKLRLKIKRLLHGRNTPQEHDG
ncbi:MAG: glycosyltransferase [Synergistaceae bacterium]|jgi:glycosyltransferase involved in cell wall biosynthesis|nr:glycosyltransferase [Synergistaceae bacterium]